MRPLDIRQLETIASISPCGDDVLVEVRRPDPHRDLTISTLRLIDPESGRARALTRGPSDSAPVLSPDGGRVAFLRRDDRGHNQAHVIAVDGGEALALATLPLGASDLAWAPSGDRVVAVARRPEPGRYGTDPAVTPVAEPPRRITTANWRLEGVGYVLDRPASLALLDVPAGSAALEAGADEPAWQWIEAPATDWAHARFTQDGSAILAIGAAHASHDDDLRRDLYEIVLDGGARNLTEQHGSFEVLSFAQLADATIALAVRDAGPDGRDYVGAGAAIAVLDAAEWRMLTDAESDDVGAVGVLAVSGESSIDALARRRGATHIVRIDAGTGEGQTLVDGPITVTAHAALRDGTTVWAAATPQVPAALGRRRGQQEHASALACELVVHPVEESVAAGPDGYPVHGWIAVPDGPGPHPVILTIHGGPYAQYGPALADELQVLVSAGYAVVQCNPRGSAGYGRAHARAIRGRVGTDDMADVLAFLDAALQDPRLDAGRVGVMGGSYGGFLTAWILGHTERFRAAIVERGWFDPAVFTGTSDIGSFYADEYIGTAPEAIARQSPQLVADRVRTPALVMHSEDDLRCPIGQSERYYTTLRRQGVPTEFVVFPGEGHELTRSGRPRHRIQRFDIVLEWWARHLGTSDFSPVIGSLS